VLHHAAMLRWATTSIFKSSFILLLFSHGFMLGKMSKVAMLDFLINVLQNTLE
jgi:hypothetical protein